MKILLDILLGLWTFIVQNGDQLVGVPMVLIVDYLNKDVHGERQRFVIAVLVCLVAAIILRYNDLLYGSPAQALLSWTVLFTESQAVFKLYFKDSWLRWYVRKLYVKEKETVVPEVSTIPETEIIDTQPN